MCGHLPGRYANANVVENSDRKTQYLLNTTMFVSNIATGGTGAAAPQVVVARTECGGALMEEKPCESILD
jgi:hypothetical protein